MEYSGFKRIRINTAVISGKGFFRLLRCLHRGGTSRPGKLALLICPDILNVVSEGINTILITGTNGKTTTARMIMHMLKEAGIPYFGTFSGGNEKSSICTEYILNYDCRLSKPRKSVAVIECDEKYIPKVIHEISPDVVVITNITEDQIDRLGTEEDVFRIMRDAMVPLNAVFCLNENDKYIHRFKEAFTGKSVVRYSGKPGIVMINGQSIPVSLNIPGEFNINNAAAACAALHAEGYLNDRTAASLETFKAPFGRMEKIDIDGVQVTLNLVKNVRGLEDMLQYIKSLSNGFRVVLGFNAKREDGRDTSWIEKMDWERYSDVLNDAAVYGENAFITKQVLIGKGIEAAYISGTDQLLSLIQKSDVPVFLIMNYTCMMDFRTVLSAKGYVKDFWNT
ncbi:MAG: DUF1727 domain-containing protein [Lachnospiraceae bacterium]|nr:DUF1727 domain-containing protein [Candidatus Darwinimomas equi]